MQELRRKVSQVGSHSQVESLSHGITRYEVSSKVGKSVSRGSFNKALTRRSQKEGLARGNRKASQKRCNAMAGHLDQQLRFCCSSNEKPTHLLFFGKRHCSSQASGQTKYNIPSLIKKKNSGFSKVIIPIHCRALLLPMISHPSLML